MQNVPQSPSQGQPDYLKRLVEILQEPQQDKSRINGGVSVKRSRQDDPQLYQMSSPRLNFENPQANSNLSFDKLFGTRGAALSERNEDSFNIGQGRPRPGNIG